MEFAILFWVIIISVWAILFAVGFSASKRTKAKRDAEAGERAKYLKNNNIERTIEYEFKSVGGLTEIHYIVDEGHKKILISQNSGTMMVIPFGEIIGCETVTDRIVSGRVGRAIIGGAIAGDAGAIVGAATAKEKVRSLQVVIYREKIQDPSVTLILIDHETKTTDSDYYKATRFAASVTSSVKAIIASTNRTVSAQGKPASKAHNDIKERLAKLQSLYDSGLITEDEYRSKREDALKEL